MSARIQSAVPILPAASVDQSLAWWTGVCSFEPIFRHGDYAGVARDGVSLHLCGFTDPALAKVVGEQTMMRLAVDDVDAFYAEYQQNGGLVHPNGALQTKPWGTREFAAIDPGGVCVSFVQA